MESDVHTPEKYGIYQPVGDTTGPGGIIRALRTIPMIEVIAKAIKEYCPKAWVINYTNPMALCIRSLYDTFPEIKAFGCCHEVFAVQELIAKAVSEATGEEITERKAVKANVVGVNHFTWITDARYRNLDVNAIYADFAEKYYESGVEKKNPDSVFESAHRVKFDLFKRYGVIAAAGDRHLAEFCEGSWYLKDDGQIREWGFVRTPVSWRKEDLKERQARSERLRTGKEPVTIQETGEDGVRQIRALLGLATILQTLTFPIWVRYRIFLSASLLKPMRRSVTILSILFLQDLFPRVYGSLFRGQPMHRLLLQGRRGREISSLHSRRLQTIRL